MNAAITKTITTITTTATMANSTNPHAIAKPL